ncbi:polysaccharide pyruvyl transferase CsaB [Halobacillus karajensis]|uniref:polysaccharide pyruvyl transferase CsaB n=1 Tax=Halobacillus karajensis TaxID=195088 RepID=UPI001ABFCED3|nr:polysaccharide pyruvyl transferase CsaB [Halobacillus karajensis]
MVKIEVKVMKLVISGYYGFQNTGDEAILKSIIQHFRTTDPSIELIVLSQQPEHTMEDYGVKAVNRWNIKEIIKALKSSDGLISGGGSLLQDTTGPKSVLYYTGVMHMARLLNRPVYIYAQGMGPLTKPFSRFLVRYALNKVDGLTVRDETSEQLLKQIGIKKEIQVYSDPVFGYSFKEKPLSRKSRLNDKPLIAVSVREWGDSLALADKLAESLDQCAARGYAISFLPMHGKADEQFSKKIARKMKKEAEVHSGDLSIDEKLMILSTCDLLIGMRLHSLIFASICSTPFAALSYDPKIEALTKQLGYPVTANVNHSDWDPSSIPEEIERLYQNLALSKEQLEEAATPHARNAQQAAKAALEIFRTKKKY